eukprot:c19036_g1_i1.p1 GENE.c19036_g1_i1~~c19036_g1_i1.p1  ORF type:complete len:118 (+),score=13.86 c19036_g1_i1:219-572(+)
MRTLKALGFRWSVLSRTVWAILFEVLQSPEKSRLRKARPLFRLWNNSIRQAIGQLTWEELSKRFEKYDVWHCRVRTSRQALDYEQAHTIGAVIRSDDGTVARLGCPIQIRHINIAVL